MPNTRAPRRGTMQYWPRKRSARAFGRVRAWPQHKDAKPLGFAGYKVGMGHIIFTEHRANSPNKGKKTSVSVTLLECPPLKVMAVAYYQKTPYGIKKVSEVRADNLDKHLNKRIRITKVKKAKVPEQYDDVKLVVHTQPGMTGIGKKAPEIFELGIGGKKEEKAAKATELLGKELNVADLFNPGEQVDAHAVTKGKGIQGPVKRFGVAVRRHKSEKTKRGPGNVGPKRGPRLWTSAHAGQMGYHLRTEFNKQVISIGKDPKGAQRSGGIMNYGAVKNPYVILHGSIPGPQKRLIRFNHAVRPNKKITKDAPKVEVLVL